MEYYFLSVFRSQSSRWRAQEPWRAWTPRSTSCRTRLRGRLSSRLTTAPALAELNAWSVRWVFVEHSHTHTPDFNCPETSSTDFILHYSPHISTYVIIFSSFDLPAVSLLSSSYPGHLCEDWTRWARWQQAKPEKEDGFFCCQVRTRSDSTSQSEKIVTLTSCTLFRVTLYFNPHHVAFITIYINIQ